MSGASDESSSSSALLSVEEHLDRILARIEPLASYPQPLSDVLGLPVSEDVHAPLPLPVFDNASMDGYAVSFRDVAEASEDRPVHLPVVGEIAAGQTRIFAMSPGTAVQIMTGAPVPEGCTAVVPFEWTDHGVAHVRIHQGPTEGQHIRLAGDDVRAGDLLMRRGDVIGARQVGVLASVGLSQVPAPARPRVVIMSTGAELVEPGRSLGRDSIYDGNSYLLAAAAREAGAIAYRVPAVTDDPDGFVDALSDQLVRADLVVTSGGVSMGTHDVVKEALRDLGTVDFVGVAMQPGKPQGFGVVGEDSTPIFTLPGNPVSSYVSFHVFVLPALRKLMGRTPLRRPLVQAKVTEALRSMPGKVQFLRGDLHHDGSEAEVSPVGDAGSHLVASLARANCLLVLDERTTRVELGDLVPVMALDGDFR